MTTFLLSLIALFLAFLSTYAVVAGRRVQHDIQALRDAATAAARGAEVIAANLAAKEHDA